MAQCRFDTLNAPADKLLLLQLIKLGGHSAISGRWAPLLQLADYDQTSTFSANHFSDEPILWNLYLQL